MRCGAALMSACNTPRICATPGRVEDSGGEALAGGDDAGKFFCRVAEQEAGIKAVALGAGDRVEHGGAHDLHACCVRAACRHQKRDRARAAVGIERRVSRPERQRVQRDGIHALSLRRVDLKKALW